MGATEANVQIRDMCVFPQLWSISPWAAARAEQGESHQLWHAPKVISVEGSLLQAQAVVLTGAADASSSRRGSEEVLLSLVLTSGPGVMSALLCCTLLSQAAHCWGYWVIETSCSKILLNNGLPFSLYWHFFLQQLKIEKLDLLCDEEQWSCTLHRFVKKLNEWKRKKWLMISAIRFPRKQGYHYSDMSQFSFFSSITLFSFLVLPRKFAAVLMVFYCWKNSSVLFQWITKYFNLFLLLLHPESLTFLRA